MHSGILGCNAKLIYIAGDLQVFINGYACIPVRYMVYQSDI